MRSQDYHTATNHTPWSVRQGPHGLDWANQPRPYKLYRQVASLPGPADLPRSSVPALAAVAGMPPVADEVTPDLGTLMAVLQYSAGVTRRLRWGGEVMQFRAAACTGALYHIELYAVCGDLPGLAAGVYHFAVPNMALNRLRQGDYRATLVAATGDEPGVALAPVTLIYTSVFWRNAWKYRDRAYRHAFWDSGTILANTLALAAAHRLPARVVTGFVDADVNRLIDVDGDSEAAIALVPLGRAPGVPPSPAPPVEPLGLETVPYSRREVPYPLIAAAHHASALATPAEVQSWRTPFPPSSHPEEGPKRPGIPLRPLADEALPSDPIETVIARRGSTRRFTREPISFATLSTMLAYAMRGVPADFLVPGASLNAPYLIVNGVDGLASGTYIYHRGHAALEELATGGFREQAGFLALEQNLAADAAVNVYFLTDLGTVLEQFGDRGYRAAQLDAAITAGRLYLCAYALGLGATGLTFYDTEVIRFFSPHAAGRSVMFLLALGVPDRRRA